MNGNKERYEKMLERLEIHLSSEQKALEGKKINEGYYVKMVECCRCIIRNDHLPSSFT
jgi:hypothetical protein